MKRKISRSGPYIVRTGMFVQVATGEKSEVVFCTSGQGGWFTSDLDAVKLPAAPP